MQRCKDIDRIDTAEEEFDDYADSYIERLIKVKRRSYNREWEDYMNYCEYKDWRDDYDCM